MLKRNLNLFYLLEGLSALALGSIIPVYVLYFREFEVTLFQVAVLAAVFEATILICEVPTGKFADRYGRKLSTSIGYFLFVVSGLIFISFKGFWGFLIAEIVFGLAEAFISGALEALTVDSFEAPQKDSNLAAVFANRAVVKNIGLLIGMLGGGYLGGIALSSLFIPLTGIMLIGFFASLFLVEPKREDEASSAITLPPHPGILRVIFGNRTVAALFMVGLLANLAFEPADQYWQVLFGEVRHLDPEWFGYLTGAGLILSAIISKATGRWFKYPGIYLSFAIIIFGIGLYAAANFSAGWAITGIIVFFVVKTVIQPVVSTNLNLQYTSMNRAAFLSSYNLTCSVGEVAAGLGAGVLISRIGAAGLFEYAAFFALLIPLAFILIYQKPQRG